MNQFGTLQDRVGWYIRAQGHSLFGALHGLGLRVKEYGLPDLVNLLRESNTTVVRVLTDFTNSDDLETQYQFLMSPLMEIRKKLCGISVPEEQRKNLEELLSIAERNLNRIGEIVKDPTYEDDIVLYNLVQDALFEVCETHPDKFPKKPIFDNKIRFEISSNVHEYPPRHRCSAYEMYLLFYNMLGNAVEAINEGVIRVHIEHKPNESYATFTIESVGSVINEENLQRIRQRILFTTKKDGHGMGMKIVYDILDKYKGNLRVSSDPQTTTTRFEFDLPYRK